VRAHDARDKSAYVQAVRECRGAGSAGVIKMLMRAPMIRVMSRVFLFIFFVLLFAASASVPFLMRESAYLYFFRFRYA